MVKVRFSNREEVIKKINNAIIGSKATRNRTILIDKVVDGLTYSEIAEKYDLSERHVKKIVHDCDELIATITGETSVH